MIRSANATRGTDMWLTSISQEAPRSPYLFSQMPWYFYVLEFVSGMLLNNGIPHFVQGVCGNRFQSPFGYPPGVGESSPLSNTLWGFANLGAGFVLLRLFAPRGSAAGWIVLALGVLLAAAGLSSHFGRVRLQQAGKFSHQRRRRSVLREGVLD
jgi:hypothetical protein